MVRFGKVVFAMSGLKNFPVCLVIETGRIDSQVGFAQEDENRFGWQRG